MTFKIVVAALTAALFCAMPSMARAPRIGEAAPPFSLKLLNGSSVTLADLRGQVVVLNFWATWCVPCRTELPTLDAFYRAQKPHGLAVFAITTEDSVPLSRMKELTTLLAIPAVRGVHGPYAPMTGVPTNYIIDRAGILRYAKAGAFDLDALNAILVPLLREPAPVEEKVAAISR